ncbi:MAG: N-acyl-D-glutamate deacylase [Anaerolineales bacterium]|nr:N-acyl-D-glutamate deacylase [Anaerolineales bacterium]
MLGQMVNFGISEDDVETVMQHPVTMVGSDGLAVAPEGRLGEVRQHPRSYGAFPRVLGVYVREKQALNLEEAIRKMTSAPAKRLSLHDRGLLHSGMRADITVFDPECVADRATFSEPYQYPVGIETVVVNGEMVIEEGHHTGQLPGNVLLKKSIAQG